MLRHLCALEQKQCVRAQSGMGVFENLTERQNESLDSSPVSECGKARRFQA